MAVPLSRPAVLLWPERPSLTRPGEFFRLRPVRRSDKASLRDMFLRCSAEDLRMRCFGISKTFPEVFAARLARLTREGEFAIAAVMTTGEIGGVVHAVALPERPGEADCDIMVRTDLKRQGLGSRLMREMLHQAGRAGFRSICSDVMMGNRGMLLLAGDLGFRRVGMEGGVVRIEVAARPDDAEPVLSRTGRTRLTGPPAA